MKFTFEEIENEWVIMIEDMRGKQRFENSKFQSKNEAIAYLRNKFKHDNDLLNAIDEKE